MIGSGALEVVLKLKDPADYEEFKRECKAAGVLPMPVSHYAQKMGMALVAMERYPDMEAKNAYLRFIEDMNMESAALAGRPVKHVPCGGCGGSPAGTDNGGRIR